MGAVSRTSLDHMVSWEGGRTRNLASSGLSGVSLSVAAGVPAVGRSVARRLAGMEAIGGSIWSGHRAGLPSASAARVGGTTLGEGNRTPSGEDPSPDRSFKDGGSIKTKGPVFNRPFCFSLALTYRGRGSARVNRTERGLGGRVLRVTCKPSAVSTAQLHPLPGFHLRPIKPVVSRRPYPVQAGGGPHLGVGFPLRCFQRLSRPDVGYPAMPLARQPAHQRSVHPGPLVLGAAPLKPPTPTADRDRPVSRTASPGFPGG
jgi:hypothetical protein